MQYAEKQECAVFYYFIRISQVLFYALATLLCAILISLVAPLLYQIAKVFQYGSQQANRG